MSEVPLTPPRLRQMREQPEEAAGDLHSLLTLARENPAAVAAMPRQGQRLLLFAHLRLQELERESAEEREEYQALSLEMGE